MSCAIQAPLFDFLVPALTFPRAIRCFSASTGRKSRIGAAPLSIPSEVQVRVLEPSTLGANPIRSNGARTVEVEGPLGLLKLEIPPYMLFNHDQQNRKVTLAIENRAERKQREMWGTKRAYLNNYVLGVSEGHTAILRLVGVGYRATVEDKSATLEPEYPGQKFLSLKVGFPHSIDLGVPFGVKASTPQPTRILLEGTDKEVVKQFAADIRSYRKPEPYKGKGVFVNDETIKLKSKKIK